MTDLVDQKIGDVGEVKVELVGAKLKISAVVSKKLSDGVDVAADVAVVIGPRALLEKLKELIPGTIDDAIINAVEAALPADAPAAPASA